MKSLLPLLPIILTHMKALHSLPTVNGSYIIGGQDAKIDAWPWQVAIYFEGNRFICGGAIISPNWVVTAAHCVQKFGVEYLEIVAGLHRLSPASKSMQSRYVDEAFIHPDWDTPQMNNDIALVKLNTPFTFSSHIRSIRLPQSHERVASGTPCYVTGWGQDKEGIAGIYTQTLKEARVLTVSKRTCADMNTRITGVEITNQMLCAGNGPEKKQASCHGDSGGPLSCKDEKGWWVLQGTVSWGPLSCSSREGYSVFARISEFVDWIHINIKKWETKL